MLSEELIPFCVLDVMNVRKWEEWEIWESKMMGLTELPYNASQAVKWYKIVALGDIKSLKNPFGR